MQRVLMVIVAALALLPVVVFAQDQSATPVVGSPVASPVASDLGRPVRWGDWTVTIERAEFADVLAPGTYAETKARGKFLIVRATLVNESLNPIIIPTEDMRARDDKGRTYTISIDASFAATAEDDTLVIGFDSLQPGVPYETILAFEVAPDAQGFVLALLGTGDLTLHLGV